jgi:exodeoxyribonuclease VII small subunit
MPKTPDSDTTNTNPAGLEHFEQSMTNLTTLVEQLEQGQLPLEQSLQQFEKGVALIRQCQQALTQAEQKIAILTEQQLEPFTSDD